VNVVGYTRSNNNNNNNNKNNQRLHKKPGQIGTIPLGQIASGWRERHEDGVDSVRCVQAKEQATKVYY
jgi:hypothetical protein